MGLLSLFQSSGKKDKAGRSSPTSVSELADAVQQARVRARHRLIGAAVLVMMGVIVFPLLFETQPRPVSVDVPIEIPRKETAPPLVMPSAKPAAGHAPSEGAATAPAEMLTETADDAGREVVPPARVAEAARPAASASSSAAAGADAHRTDAAARFVVQAGAFADNTAAKEVRTKVEKLGIKTFVQIVDTAEGKRIRIRAGPYNSREEADKVLARMKAGGVSAVVLAL